MWMERVDVVCDTGRMSTREVLDLLRQTILECGGIVHAARHLNVSPQLISNTIAGRRVPSGAICRALNLKLVRVYEPLATRRDRNHA